MVYEVIEKQIKEFCTVANTVKCNIDNILNFFNNRSTNTNAESFNSKLKLFRANLRGVTDTKFFLFRLAKLFVLSMKYLCEPILPRIFCILALKV